MTQHLSGDGGRHPPPTNDHMPPMSGIPSIVAGLLIYTVWVSPDLPILGKQGFSGIAASMALTVVMLPFVTHEYC